LRNFIVSVKYSTVLNLVANFEAIQYAMNSVFVLSLTTLNTEWEVSINWCLWCGLSHFSWFSIMM